MIEIYTDGAYATSRNQGGWAFVVLKDGKKIYSDFGGILNTTNNRMEIQSVIEGINYLIEQKITEFTIYTDSMYVVGTMSLNWKKKKNLDLWEILFNIISGLTIEWKHVKGHNGDTYNEICDALATEGTKVNL